ncbi:uncharacterized protein LOC126370487 isoform X1 [Pectinophora gossypiella]|uniref:uncharacterized protein LOC126370487 isoform X1 n=1 Tax=Pectinophora gossypiella TaxID=13191 RepID=UPI00214E7E87|nr:uncharacterized protein LOC126370487 isoform X1 [Pectinophora gossypiella]
MSAPPYTSEAFNNIKIPFTFSLNIIAMWDTRGDLIREKSTTLLLETDNSKPLSFSQPFNKPRDVVFYQQHFYNSTVGVPDPLLGLIDTVFSISWATWDGIELVGIKLDLNKSSIRDKINFAMGWFDLSFSELSFFRAEPFGEDRGIS